MVWQEITQREVLAGDDAIVPLRDIIVDLFGQCRAEQAAAM
jgi:hypothetical protein